jgi:hypothetical protein
MRAQVLEYALLCDCMQLTCVQDVVQGAQESWDPGDRYTTEHKGVDCEQGTDGHEGRNQPHYKKWEIEEGEEDIFLKREGQGERQGEKA